MLSPGSFQAKYLPICACEIRRVAGTRPRGIAVLGIMALVRELKLGRSFGLLGSQHLERASLCL
jgi:hypothetical protein